MAPPAWQLAAVAALVVVVMVVDAFVPQVLPTRSGRHHNTLCMHQHLERRELLGHAAAALASVMALQQPGTAEAWCGEQYPSWAYNLDFDEGAIPITTATFSGDIFVRVVGSEKSERKAKRFPLVVIGTAQLAHAYLETLEAAAKDDRRVVLWDPLGTGASSAARAGAPPLEQQLQAVLDFLGIKSYHLLGHGTGAATALDIAAAAGGADAGKGVLSLCLAAPLLRGEPRGYLSAIDKAYSSNNTKVPICLVDSQPKASGSADGDGAAEGSQDVQAELPRVRVPLLVLIGDADPWISQRTAEQLSGAAEGGKAQVVVGSGHLAHLDNREDFLQAVMASLLAADAVNAQAAR